jgi:CBS domain-containing protein
VAAMSYRRPPEQYVSHSMSTDLLTVGREEPLVVAAGRMVERRVGAVLVIASGGSLEGILTERDVLRAVAHASIAGSVAEWMTSDPVTVEPGATNAEAAMMMLHGGFRHVPVCEGGTPVGIVSIRDLLRLANESPAGV